MLSFFRMSKYLEHKEQEEFKSDFTLFSKYEIVQVTTVFMYFSEVLLDEEQGVCSVSVTTFKRSDKNVNMSSQEMTSVPDKVFKIVLTPFSSFSKQSLFI